MRQWQSGYWTGIAICLGCWFWFDRKGAATAASLAHELGDWLSRRAARLGADGDVGLTTRGAKVGQA